jgi:cell pole-organizing protein PopZ
MSAKPAEQDNSIEEILASIRQIISEDDPKAEGGAGLAQALSPVDEAPNSVSQEVDDVFELVDRVVAEEEPAAPIPQAMNNTSAIDHGFTLPPAPAPIKHDTPPLPRVAEAVAGEGVFGQVATNATLGAFAELSQKISFERQSVTVSSSVTLEQIVKELLHPILRQWIDQHVPSIVDRLVREELEKIARQAREG